MLYLFIRHYGCSCSVLHFLKNSFYNESQTATVIGYKIVVWLMGTKNVLELQSKEEIKPRKVCKILLPGPLNMLKGFPEKQFSIVRASHSSRIKISFSSACRLEAADCARIYQHQPQLLRVPDYSSLRKKGKILISRGEQGTLSTGSLILYLMGCSEKLYQVITMSACLSSRRALIE